MNKNVVRSFVTIALLAFLATAGCAKKVKSDLGDQALGGIQDKDLAFDATGSDSGKIEGLYTVHFEYDKSSLTTEDRDLLVKNAGWLKLHKSENLQIEGHCDRNGSIEYNLALGQRRAEAVQKYLINLGVKKDRLSTISYGKEKLLDTADTEQADAKNRRANFRPINSPKLNQMSNL